MRTFRTLLASALLLAATAGQGQSEPVRLQVDAATQIATVTKLFNGTNIEDLNNQTNGGIFSQLLHGEAFEENMDVDFLGLSPRDYSKVYVVLDERRIPHLISQANIYHRIRWNSRTEKYDVNSKDVYDAPKTKHPLVISGWKFWGRFVPFDSIPADVQQVMLDRLNGREQISKYWSKLTSGSPQYRYELLRDGQAYIGRQTQVVQFEGGAGEVGLTNHGLYRMGIAYASGKPYGGVLRVKSEKPQTLYLSLRGDDGQVLAEQGYELRGDGTYERVAFRLTPASGARKGSFGIALKAPGRIDLGFAFLQPGEWGRAGGYPIRKSFVDALKRQGISAFRYNGSMVDVGADTYLYRWKRMIGPVDERRTTLRTGFNLYSTHSFGFIEMLQAAEAVGAEPIIGMSMDETAEDIRDFVEYVNGPASSEWGALRARHGHPEPYGLKYIEVDNERFLTPGYAECVKKFARAAWEADPQMTIMVSLNIGRDGYKRGTPAYELASSLAGWFIGQGKGDRFAWDPHYSGDRRFADDQAWFENEMGITLQKELAKDHPGFKLNLHPMEENGSRCDWDRGLAHASNWNTLQRYGNCFRMLGTANTFQPHHLEYMWDQGRIHYTSDTLWFQPSACIDEMMMETWKPNVVQTSSSDAALDITAKINDEKTEMTLYIANMSDEPREAVLDIEGFKYRTKAEVQTIGGCDLTEYNTRENPQNVAFRPSTARIARKNARYTFPRYSYTVITLRR